MTISKHAGVTYEVQSAGTLAAGQSDSFSATTMTTVLIDDATTLKARDNVSIGSSSARFIRLKVIGAPGNVSRRRGAFLPTSKPSTAW